MKSHSRRTQSPPRHLHRPLALAVALALGAVPVLAQAATGELPRAGSVVSGKAGISFNPGQFDNVGVSQGTTITQTSKGAVINWGSFSIGSKNTVTFDHQVAGGVTLNRVIGFGDGPTASNILGALNAPSGSVFLINPAGIMFGGGSTVNVGGLVASTLTLGDDVFNEGVKSGKFRFGASDGGGGVENHGSITITTPGGMAALLSGDSVLNAGSIKANGGSIGLGWGQQIEINLGGDGLTSLIIDPAGNGSGISSLSNTGILQADGGVVQMRSGVGDITGVVNQSGTIRARSLSTAGGHIVLDSGRNPLDVSGSHDVSAAGAGVAGGSIDVISHRTMWITPTASFNGSGGNGGANGTLTFSSDSSMLVLGKDLFSVNTGNTTLTNYSMLTDAPLGAALSRNTDVILNAVGDPARGDVSGAFDGSVWFMDGGSAAGVDRPDALIGKTAGGSARLQVNANRNITMQEGSAITATAGALEVNFNADSHGEDAGVGQDYGNGRLETGGSISMLSATIQSNGGNVAFYGQSDADNGRARGAALGAFRPGQPTSGMGIAHDGIGMEFSTISTCAGGADNCTGAGTVSLRGQGYTPPSGIVDSNSGIGMELAGSHLLSGSGEIVLDGVGSVGGSGVVVADGYLNDVLTTPSSLTSRGGAIRITGLTPDQPAASTTLLSSAGSGVIIGNHSSLSAGTDIFLVGHGGDLSISLPGHQKQQDDFASSDGVDIFGASLQAGAGHSIRIKGTAGSDGTAPAADPATGNVVLPAAAIRVSQNAGPRSTLQSAGGAIDLTGTGDIYLDNSLIGVQSSNGNGGSIKLDAENILLGGSSRLDASGSGDGGSVTVNAGGITAMDATASVLANAGAGGHGGNIRLDGGSGLRAFGSLAARGDGGSIETSGAYVDVRGIRIDAGDQGHAGLWLIDPYDVSIVAGAATGSLDSNPFAPMSDSTIQDGDINQALNNNTSVTITTGDPAVGTSNGNISIGYGVLIDRDQGTTPLDLKLEAHASISGNSFTIRSSVGALNMDFDSDADGLLFTNGAGIHFGNMTLQSNGGDIRMFGQHDAAAGFASGIMLTGSGSLIDTRTDGSDTGPAGDVLLRGQGQGDQALGVAGVELQGGYTPGGFVINTGSGNIDVVGRGDNGGDGIAMSTNNVGAVELLTGSGHIHLTGFGSATDPLFSSNTLGHGITSTINPFSGPITLSTTSGEIDLRGHGIADGVGSNAQLISSHGILLNHGTTVQSASGNIFLTGSSLGSGMGIALLPDASSGAVDSLLDAGSGNLVLRAHNSPVAPTSSISLGAKLHSTHLVNIRGGSVGANGNVVENPADLIAINPGTPVTGLDVFQADLANISAGTLVLGSNIQSGNVYVDGASGNITYNGNLTLSAAGGGSVQLNGSAIDVGANTLALIAGSTVSQVGTITAGSLLAVSQNGSVLLANPLNQVSAQTVAGSAATDFVFVNAGDVGIGLVNANGITAAGNTPLALAGNGINADGNVLAQSIGGNVLLNGDVSGNAVNLVADGTAGLFINGGGSITASSYWHVWASSWIGESRDGLAGNGTLPNLYGCMYGSTCSVTPSTTANQFIYIQRPIATVDLASSTREYGLPNAALTYNVNGMILGDQAANAITGTPTTSATQASHVGSYAMGGSFLSPAGYLVQVNPGALAVTPATLTYVANPYNRIYGDPNGALDGTVTGFRLSDSLASATTGALAFTTAATQNANVGTYAINGSGLSAGDYVFVQATGNANAFAITPATLTYVADPYSRVYGDPNGTLGGTVNGFRLSDTLSSATTGTLAFNTPATQGSNVGTYAITGSGLDAANYVFTQAGGNATAFAITPATLTYMADPYQRTVGVPNAPFGGQVSGFRNGDTLASSTTGTPTFQSTAGTYSPVGAYAINGVGLSANNYVFVQATGNAVALTIVPPAASYSLDFQRDTPVTYVYDRNFGIVGLCPATDLASASRDKDGDTLAREWSRVRSRPNLANCVSTKQNNSCGNF